MHDPYSMSFDHRDSTRNSGTRPGVPTASTCWRGALPDFDVFGSRPFRPLTSLEGHGLALTKIVEPGTSARRVVEEVSFPSLARMNPNPLSLTRRLIVPFIGAMEYPLHPFRSKRGMSILGFGTGPIAIR